MEDIPGFAGFENFQGFPKKALTEDRVEYFIYPESITESSNTKLTNLKNEVLNFIKLWTDEFIWQQDPFELEVVEKNGVSYLHGDTGFGDSIDDEWFIVFLLREISVKFPELWIRTVDTDGEFLLIEAAHALPRWLSPETADFRVWINKGSLLIIPRSVDDRAAAKAGALRSLEEKDALTFIRGSRDKMLRIQLVEEEAFYRIARYPEALDEHFHHALVTVPRNVAKILKERPKSISSIVDAVYLRDPVSLRICNTMPNFPPRDPVNMSVKFTKILYAQLKQQVLTPPRPFILPPDGSSLFAASETGMKLTCGLEMMVAVKAKSGSKAAVEIEEIMKVAKEGSLPTDDDIKTWDKKVDDEAWMDVDYEEFDANLSGRGKEGGAFGDKEQQDKLKKMVENFERFMNDESAGLGGAELGDDGGSDVDDDDEGDISTEDEDEGEDKETSFDEKEFGKLMREMMGFPPETAEPSSKNIIEEDQSDDDDDENAIRQTMAKMEQELVEAGALERDRPGSAFVFSKKGKAKGKQKVLEDDDDDVAVDYTVAKNLLESLKSQGGMSGPAGNLLSSMGIRMPRDDSDGDEGDEEDEVVGTKSAKP